MVVCIGWTLVGSAAALLERNSDSSLAGWCDGGARTSSGGVAVAAGES